MTDENLAREWREEVRGLLSDAEVLIALEGAPKTIPELVEWFVQRDGLLLGEPYMDERRIRDYLRLHRSVPESMGGPRVNRTYLPSLGIPPTYGLTDAGAALLEKKRRRRAEEAAS